MAEPDLYWTGASGKKYGYWVKKLPYHCNAGQDGNYMFCKVVSNEWVPVYIGQGDIDNRVNDPTHYQCATGKSAQHVHVHTNSSERDRLAEEDDLLSNFHMAYEPTGCNRKLGG